MKKNKEEVESHLYDLWLQKLIQHPFQNFRLLLNQLSSHTRVCVDSFWPWDSAPGRLALPRTAGLKSCLFFYGEFHGENSWWPGLGGFAAGNFTMMPSFWESKFTNVVMKRLPRSKQIFQVFPDVSGFIPLKYSQLLALFLVSHYLLQHCISLRWDHCIG